MSQPLPLDALPHGDSAEAWVLKNQTDELLLAIPDPRFPTHNPLRVFATKFDAQRFLSEILEAGPNLTRHQMTPVSVELGPVLDAIRSGGGEGGIDSYLRHGQYEHFEFDLSSLN